MLASGGRGEATYVHLSPTGLHVWRREGSWTVGGRGGPGLTPGTQRTRDTTYTCAIVAQSSGQSATTALPRQPCADVAPVQ